jgi:hypothetical protein
VRRALVDGGHVLAQLLLDVGKGGLERGIRGGDVRVVPGLRGRLALGGRALGGGSQALEPAECA